jgi:hypothetical protein
MQDAELLGAWPSEAPARPGFTLPRDPLSGEPLPAVLVARLEVEAPWHLPARFGYGGWNECPPPEVHCALWQRWLGAYEAHIVGMSHDVIEARVLAPPRTQEQCIALAWEHYSYCSDIVLQGTETISQLAAALQDHDVWYFWWD